MNTRKMALWATTALAGGLLSATGAWAQSTGSQEIDEAPAVEAVVVTGQRGPRNVDGLIQAETAPKARSTVTEEFIATQPAGQTIFQTLNIVPGLNFVNNDPYGSSGGNVRLRGFDGNRISLTFDGIPLNDTGNYAIFTNQQLDPELITRANVNTGTTDVDSPTASATGGTINYVTRRPEKDFGGTIVGSVGSFDYRRIFGRLESGEFGPWGTTAFATASYTNYDKFRGPGELEKKQYNGRIYQTLSGNNFVSLAGHWNENRNNQYNNITLADIRANGYGFDQDKQCIRATPVAGTIQNETTGNTVVTSQDVTRTATSCTSYFNVRINPSNTGNLRGQSAFDLGRGFRLTFDPYAQYTLANGGGFTVINERDDRLDQAGGTGTVTGGTVVGGGLGVDLNGDGDTLDQVMTYSPNNTNTRRYGFTSSLIWDLNDDHRLRAAWTMDYGQHRQTGEFTSVDAQGNPLNVFGGKDGAGGPKIVGRDGSFLRGRDRFSIASLNQIAFQYRGDFMDDRLHLDLGVRAPFFERELNQFCFSQTGSTNVRCTTEAPSATLANGNVRFVTTGATEFIPAYRATREYDAVLPNVGLSFDVAGPHSVFISYAEGFSAPRTDSLYTVSRVNGQIATPGVEPETTQNWDLGYRYNTPDVVAFATIFQNTFQNRIVSSFDQELGFTVDRNIGSVESWGVDGQIAAQVQEIVTLYFSASYLNAEVQDDLRIGAAPTTPAAPTNLLPTKGKTLVETPEWQFGMRAELEPWQGVRFGLTGKYVDSRYSTDVNDEEAPEYTVWNADVRYDLDRHGFNGSYVQLNLINIFDREYLGNISSQTNARPIPGVTNSSGTPRYSVGAPFTAQLSLHAEF